MGSLIRPHAVLCNTSVVTRRHLAVSDIYMSFFGQNAPYSLYITLCRYMYILSQMTQYHPLSLIQTRSLIQINHKKSREIWSMIQISIGEGLVSLIYNYTVEPLTATPPSSGNLRIACTTLGTGLHRRLHCMLATSQEWKPPNSE